MSKNSIIAIVAVVIFIIIITAGWFYFSRTNSVTSQLSGVSTKVKSSDKSIASFTLSGLDSKASEVVDNTKHTVTIIVPSGTNITNLTPIISVSDSSNILPNSGAPQNFTSPIVYLVTAQDGSTQKYTVTVETATAQGTGGS